MEELIATLERETDERCTTTLEEARREAERIRRETDERLESRRAAAARAADEESRRWESEGLATTRTEVRGAILRARRHAVDRVFRRAAELLPAASEDSAYLEQLPDELRRALSCVADREVEIECSPGLVPHLRAVAATVTAEGPGEPPGIRVSPSEAVSAGFVVRGTTSGVRVDVTLATRLEVVRPELEAHVLQGLERPEGGEQ